MGLSTIKVHNLTWISVYIKDMMHVANLQEQEFQKGFKQVRVFQHLYMEHSKFSSTMYNDYPN